MEWANSMSKTKTATSPPREDEPGGTHSAAYCYFRLFHFIRISYSHFLKRAMNCLSYIAFSF